MMAARRGESERRMNGGASRWMDVGEERRPEGTQEVRKSSVLGLGERLKEEKKGNGIEC